MRHLLIILTLFGCVAMFSQNTEPTNIEVGLVLSGGGAKGLAHIGVLKVIDSLGLRIDYVAGTSMGAIVGALYASGYTGKEIDSVFKAASFDDLINDNLPRAAKTLYERENSEKYAIVLPFENFKIKLPSALSRGQNVYGLLSKLTLHINNIETFMELPIPFFCIATNIETGQAVMLEKGNLAQAIMASGAFPSLFQPVVIDNNILIDGGVVNNYPIDELKKKGLDVIIGVDVQDSLATRKELTSAPDILLQINNFRTINEMKLKSKKTDIYIKPDVEDFNVVSFSEGNKLIDIGRLAALKKLESLRYVTSLQTNNITKSPKIKPVDSIKINSISIKGINKYTRPYILGKLKLMPKTKTSYNKFNNGINNLVATNNFDNFIYDLKPSKHLEGYDMHTVLKESPQTTFLKIGVHYDDLYKSSALINLTKKRLFVKNDVVSFDFIPGDNIRYNFDYYIDNGFHWSIGARSRYNEFHKNVSPQAILAPDELALINVNKLELEVKDFTNQIYIQTQLRNDFSFVFGAEHKNFKLSSETILVNTNKDETVFKKRDYFSLFGKLKFDSYDNPYLPKKGFLFDSDFHLYSSNAKKGFLSFSIGQAAMGYSQSFSKKFSANISAEGGFRLGEDSDQYLNFVLGGYGNHLINNYTPFFGYDYISIQGDSFVKSTLTLNYEIFKKNHLNISANVANVENDIFQTGEWLTAPDFTGYALGYSLETFLGPVEVKYSWSPETKLGVWFFNLGFWF